MVRKGIIGLMLAAVLCGLARNASAQAASAAYGPLSGETATARFSLVDDRLTFTDLRFRSCGGAWSHTGSYLLRPKGALSGRVTVTGATPAAVLGIFFSNQFADLAGIVPDVGRFDPCPWGLGVEIRGNKAPHWTGRANSVLPLTYSVSLFLSLTFLPMRACLRSKNFMDQSVAIDAGARLLRPLSNWVFWCRSAASDRSRSISARALCSALDVSRCW